MTRKFLSYAGSIIGGSIPDSAVSIDFTTGSTIGTPSVTASSVTVDHSAVGATANYVEVSFTAKAEFRVYVELDVSALTANNTLFRADNGGGAILQLMWLNASSLLRSYLGSADATESVNYVTANGYADLTVSDESSIKVEILVHNGLTELWIDGILRASAGGATPVSISRLRFGDLDATAQTGTVVVSNAVYRADSAPIQYGKRFALIVAAGQSNMSPIGGSPADPVLDNVPYTYYLAENTSSLSSTPFDEVTLVTQFLQDATLPAGYAILLLQVAYGSTGFVGGLQEWAAAGSRRVNLTDRITQFITALNSCYLAGFLWHHGETDAGLMTANEYQAALEDLVGEIRTVGGNSAAPFIAGQMAESNLGNPSYAAIDTGTQAAVAALSNAGFASSSGLTQRDAVHFDEAGLRTLGERYAEQWNAI